MRKALTLILAYFFLFTCVNAQQADSVGLKCFKVDKFFISTNSVVDSSISASLNFNPVKSESLPAYYLGNMGTPFLNVYFFDRSNLFSDFSYANTLSAYLSEPSKTVFYKTRSPYTYVHYTSGGGQKQYERTIDVFNTQNVNDKWNFGFHFKKFNSAENYQYQKSKNNIFGLFSSYEGKYYSIWGQANYNAFVYNENGGLKTDADLLKLGNADYTAEGLDINLTTAQSKYKLINFHIEQVFKNNELKKDSGKNVFTIGHVLDVSSHKRSFADKFASKTSEELDFYQHCYGDTLKSDDSIRLFQVSNTLQLSFIAAQLPGAPALRIFAGNNLGIWNCSVPSDTILLDSITTLYINKRKYNQIDNFVGFAFSGGQYNIFTWNAEGKSYLTGYRQGDFNLSVEIGLNENHSTQLPGLKFKAEQSRETPSWMTDNFISNHFIWTSGTKPLNATILKGQLIIPWIKSNIEGSWGRYGNYLYYNEYAYPKYIDNLYIWGLKIKNDVGFGKFHTQNVIYFQKSSSSNLNLPSFSISHSLWFNHTFNFKITGGKLSIQTGYQVQYFNEFYIDGYMPASGVFYTQNQTKYGNYPYIDVYQAFQVKRTQFFVRYEHVNEGIEALSERKYFTASHYPLTGRMLKFGIKWFFEN
jgi:hypothetical protein